MDDHWSACSFSFCSTHRSAPCVPLALVLVPCCPKGNTTNLIAHHESPRVEPHTAGNKLAQVSKVLQPTQTMSGASIMWWTRWRLRTTARGGQASRQRGEPATDHLNHSRNQRRPSRALYRSDAPTLNYERLKFLHLGRDYHGRPP